MLLLFLTEWEEPFLIPKLKVMRSKITLYMLWIVIYALAVILGMSCLPAKDSKGHPWKAKQVWKRVLSK